MNEYDRNQIMKMTKILGSEYFDHARDSLAYANKKIDTFSSLLIVIAFSSIGLSVQLLDKKSSNEEIISWGIISLATSIIFGLSQLLIDHKFFIKMSNLYNDISTKHSLISTGEFQENNIKEALELLEKHKNSKDSSNIYPLYLELILVCAGAFLILSQLLFKN